MERISVPRAEDVLRRSKARIHKRNHRIHENAMDDNANKARALKGICGGCAELIAEVGWVDGKECVKLSCKAGRSPLNLYRETELGQVPECESFEPVE